MSKYEKEIENIYNNFDKLDNQSKRALINALIQIMIVRDDLDFKRFIQGIQLCNKMLGLPYEL